MQPEVMLPLKPVEMNISSINFATITNTNAARRMSYEDALKDKKFRELGEGSGISFSFLENEVVVFPELSQAFPWTKKFRDTEVMYITAWSMDRNRFVDIPLATFRKRPVGEGELDALYNHDERPLTCHLCEASNDLERFRILCETRVIKCTDIFRDLHAWVYETDADGKVHRTDKTKTLIAYEVKPEAYEETAPDNAQAA